MTPAPASPAATGSPRWPALLGWRRVRTTAITCAILALLFSISWEAPRHELWLQIFGVGFGLLVVFGLFEQWPRRLPRWLARWALQVVSVGAAVPLLLFIAYWLRADAAMGPFWLNEKRAEGFAVFVFVGTLLAPWMALSALVRQREAWAQEQALAFELERSELARQALDARLRLLSAQAQPHFLFNTLANVQALVEAGSPRAAQLLQSLTAYLRAAVPRLDDAATTLGQELDLVRAYLELMQMRMPDRLQFALHIAADVRTLRCPPMTLLTLVENAVRHGIDPSIEGGRIDIRAAQRDGRCHLSVADTGVGLQAGGGGLGTGLAALRERLALVFGGDAKLTLREAQPHGVVVEIDMPARAQGNVALPLSSTPSGGGPGAARPSGRP